MKTRRASSSLVAVVIFSSLSGLFSQVASQATQPQLNQSLLSNTDLISVRFSVVDSHGRFVAGLPKVRRVERALIGEYRELVTGALDTPQLALQLAELADVVRGYEEIKLRNVERFRAEAERLVTEQPLLVVRQSALTTR